MRTAEADVRIWPLVEQYCKLAKVKLILRGDDLYELKLPPSERAHFGERASVRVALSLDALERDPDAEMAVLGSPFLGALFEAIRARPGSGRLSLGMLPLPNGSGLGPGAWGLGGRGGRGPGDRGRRRRRDVVPGADLTVPVRDGAARRRKSQLATHTIGRLLARVVLRAGAVVEEVVIESAVIDLGTGARADDQVTRGFADLVARRIRPADPDDVPDGAQVPARAPAEMLQLLLGDLRAQSAERVAARQAAAEQGVAAELERLDRYFASVLADKTDPDDMRTIKALHERRRAEEMRRHQVMAIVHPLQLVDAQVLMQQVEWEIRSKRGVRARFAAQRPIAGSANWILACPRCGRPPAELVVCVHDVLTPRPPLRSGEGEAKQGHCACDACSTRCSVCAADFCADHGIAHCRVDEQPACEQHARVCPSCRMAHCSTHEGRCAGGEEDESEHPACSACLEPCGSCGRVVCNRHAEQSRADAPKGSRRLCSACVRHCEGGTNEPVGVDEVVECTSCGRSVCTAHQAVCAVDGQIQCSRHLRRADGSGRLVCEKHRATCVAEPEAVFASDEVSVCPVCGKTACDRHRDAAGHCATCAQLETAEPPSDPISS